MTDFKHDRLPPDARGTIDKLEVSGVKFNVIFSKAGTYRSGDVHPNTQYDLVLSGQAEITQRAAEAWEARNLASRTTCWLGHTVDEWTSVLLPGEKCVIPKGHPHLFYFPVDTVMLEWWDGPFDATYYEPYRKIVEAQNA